jgi:predicted enzyme related to lactoylglutathione lyase
MGAIRETRPAVRSATMPNKVDYFEIGSPDPAASQAFFGGLFDWEFSDPTPAAYRYVNTSEGGLWDTTAMGGVNYAVFYVHVDDVQASIDKAVSLGASVAIPFVDNGQIQFAHLLDPQGSRFAVWRRVGE